jgi:hypothetical protein
LSTHSNDGFTGLPRYAVGFDVSPEIFDGHAQRTTNQMRQEIDDMARGVTWSAPMFGPSSPLARRVLDLARHRGLSGEDAYTVLAYMALKQLDKMYEALLHSTMTAVNPPQVDTAFTNVSPPPAENAR